MVNDIKNIEATRARTKKIVLCGIFIAIATILGSFSIPVPGGAKAAPVQHLINVISAVVLGPIYGIACAFTSSLLRNILGVGSLLAFPGSMVGVLLAGLAYKKFNKIEFAVIGEVIGTGIIGALLAYPVTALIIGKEVALFVYIVPFTISSVVGSIIAYVVLKIKSIRKALTL